MRNQLGHYRSEALKAAIDLGYGDEIVKSVRQAKDEKEIETIMRKARKEYFK